MRALGLDGAVFGGTSDRIVTAWRARAARMYPSDFADSSEPVRYTLLAALCWTRQAELVDGLVELLTGLIHRINARAERRVEKELIGELADVPGKRGIFTRMVDAALEHPDDTVREAVYPVVPGGVKTLAALARELKATERAVTERVRYQLRGSYSHYCRRMLAPLLAALEFRCNNAGLNPARCMSPSRALSRHTLPPETPCCNPRVPAGVMITFPYDCGSQVQGGHDGAACRGNPGRRYRRQSCR